MTAPRGGDPRHDPQIIPGAYDRSTLTYRQLGSMGGAAYGTADIPAGASQMDAATTADRRNEGGGNSGQQGRHQQRGAGGARA